MFIVIIVLRIQKEASADLNQSEGTVALKIEWLWKPKSCSTLHSFMDCGQNLFLETMLLGPSCAQEQTSLYSSVLDTNM